MFFVQGMNRQPVSTTTNRFLKRSNLDGVCSCFLLRR